MAQKFRVPTAIGFAIIDADEIVVCTAARSYTTLHLANHKKMVISSPLTDIEQLLPTHQFLRVHRSYLINLVHVKEYVRGEGGSLVMSNEIRVEVSRRRKEQFMLAIKEHLKGNYLCCKTATDESTT
jgi:two-component system LytT family response regulator